MYNTQLKVLNFSILKKADEESIIVSLEPMLLKKKSSPSKLKEGDCLDLGSEPPSLEIRRASTLLARASMGRYGRKFALRIGSLEREEEDDMAKKSKKSRIVRAPLALMNEKELKSGNIVLFDWNIYEGFPLFLGDRLFASASLYFQNGRYILEIEELCQ